MSFVELPRYMVHGDDVDEDVKDLVELADDLAVAIQTLTDSSEIKKHTEWYKDVVSYLNIRFENIMIAKKKEKYYAETEASLTKLGAEKEPLLKEYHDISLKNERTRHEIEEKHNEGIRLRDEGQRAMEQAMEIEILGEDMKDFVALRDATEEKRLKESENQLQALREEVENSPRVLDAARTKKDSEDLDKRIELLQTELNEFNLEKASLDKELEDLRKGSIPKALTFLAGISVDYDKLEEKRKFYMTKKLWLEEQKEKRRARRSQGLDSTLCALMDESQTVLDATTEQELSELSQTNQKPLTVSSRPPLSSQAEMLQTKQSVVSSYVVQQSKMSKDLPNESIDEEEAEQPGDGDRTPEGEEEREEVEEGQNVEEGEDPDGAQDNGRPDGEDIEVASTVEFGDAAGRDEDFEGTVDEAYHGDDGNVEMSDEGMNETMDREEEGVEEDAAGELDDNPEQEEEQEHIDHEQEQMDESVIDAPEDEEEETPHIAPAVEQQEEAPQEMNSFLNNMLGGQSASMEVSQTIPDPSAALLDISSHSQDPAADFLNLMEDVTSKKDAAGVEANVDNVLASSNFSFNFGGGDAAASGDADGGAFDFNFGGGGAEGANVSFSMGLFGGGDAAAGDGATNNADGGQFNFDFGF